MVTTEERRQQNKFAQQRCRQRKKDLVGKEKGLAKDTLHDTCGIPSSNTDRSELLQKPGDQQHTTGRDYAHQETSTLLPHLWPSESYSGTALLHNDYADSFLQSPPLSLRFRFSPDEDFVTARLQFEVATKLFQWLVPIPSLPPVQTNFLHDVLQLWHRKEAIFRREFFAQYDATYRVFEAWIKSRLIIADLSSKLRSRYNLPPSVSTVMERIHALNALRAEKLTLLCVCADEKHCNELLAKVLSLLTDTHGTDFVFLHGICRLQQEDMTVLGMIESYG